MTMTIEEKKFLHIPHLVLARIFKEHKSLCTPKKFTFITSLHICSKIKRLSENKIKKIKKKNFMKKNQF